MNGFNLKTVQYLLGHKDIRMTLRYAHLSGEHLQAAVFAPPCFPNTEDGLVIRPHRWWIIMGTIRLHSKKTPVSWIASTWCQTASSNSGTGTRSWPRG
jgi:hypothetical protein